MRHIHEMQCGSPQCENAAYTRCARCETPYCGAAALDAAHRAPCRGLGCGDKGPYGNEPLGDETIDAEMMPESRALLAGALLVRTLALAARRPCELEALLVAKLQRALDAQPPPFLFAMGPIRSHFVLPAARSNATVAKRLAAEAAKILTRRSIGDDDIVARFVAFLAAQFEFSTTRPQPTPAAFASFKATLQALFVAVKPPLTQETLDALVRGAQLVDNARAPEFCATFGQGRPLLCPEPRPCANGAPGRGGKQRVGAALDDDDDAYEDYEDIGASLAPSPYELALALVIELVNATKPPVTACKVEATLVATYTYGVESANASVQMLLEQALRPEPKRASVTASDKKAFARAAPLARAAQPLASTLASLNAAVARFGADNKKMWARFANVLHAVRRKAGVVDDVMRALADGVKSASLQCNDAGAYAGGARPAACPRPATACRVGAAYGSDSDSESDSGSGSSSGSSSEESEYTWGGDDSSSSDEESLVGLSLPGRSKPRLPIVYYESAVAHALALLHLVAATSACEISRVLAGDYTYDVATADDRQQRPLEEALRPSKEWARASRSELAEARKAWASKKRSPSLVSALSALAFDVWVLGVGSKQWQRFARVLHAARREGGIRDDKMVALADAVKRGFAQCNDVDGDGNRSPLADDARFCPRTPAYCSKK